MSYNASTKVATFTTAAALLPDTSYTATITQGAVTLATGTPTACIFAWNFKTTATAVAGLPPVNLGLAAPFAIAAAAGVANTLTVPLTHINGDVVLDPTTTCFSVPIDAVGGFGACGGRAPTLTGQVISPLFPDAGVTSGNIKADLLAAYNSILPANLPGAPGSEIRLINGAKASNVFWQVGSSAVIGTYALFQGNILADTSITMGTSSTSCGRLLAGAVTASGAFIFDTNVVSVPGNGCPL